jgi:1-acyl-sn-glycerol-3-phosphate acyltransferase
MALFFAPGTTLAYRAVISASTPIMWPWSRLTAHGVDCIPETGPVLIVSNHDSYWDPVAIGFAARRRRMIQALAKDSLWKNAAVGTILTGMGQIPIKRGTGDSGALDEAARQLREGACVGVFPEGTRSEGRELRARSGAGWLAHAVPEATVVCARVRGTVDVVRLPKRPHIEVEFFLPEGGGMRPDEGPQHFMNRLIKEIRSEAPRVVPGRGKTAEKFAARNAELAAKKG